MPGEESLTIFVDQRKFSRGPEVGIDLNSTTTLTLEALHQLAASYFIDRESTLRKLHHLQIASSAIKVRQTVTEIQQRNNGFLATGGRHREVKQCCFPSLQYCM